MPRGPRCLRWSILRLSGPRAVEFEDLEMASLTWASVKGVKFLSRGWALWSLRMTLRESLLD